MVICFEHIQLHSFELLNMCIVKFTRLLLLLLLSLSLLSGRQQIDWIHREDTSGRPLKEHSYGANNLIDMRVVTTSGLMPDELSDFVA